MENEQLKASGYTGEIEFDGREVAIAHNRLGRIGGWKDPHKIDISRIGSVRFVAANLMTNGRLEIDVPGEVQVDGKTSRNTVIFTRKQEGAFAAIHAEIEKALQTRPVLSAEVQPESQDQRLGDTRPVIYGDFILSGGLLGYTDEGTRKTKDLGGATASFESGADRSRPTLTRIAAGTLLAGPIGAVGGALLKKNTSKCYVTVLFSDGDAIIIEGPTKDERKLREFAAKVNQHASI